MTGSEAGGRSPDDDARQAAIRTFFMALGLTPMLLVPTTTGSLGEISAETALLAGLVGVVVGAPTFLLVDRLDFRDVNDAVALVVMLALVVVAVVVT
jgi:peptidoglycan/LPS O-acetylase OafA/YrhL